MSHQEQSSTRKIRLSTIVYTILVVVLFAFSLSLIAVYTTFGSTNATNQLKSKLPYPIVLMDYRYSISFRTLAKNMISVKRFYETQDFSKVGLRVDFSTEDGQKRFKVREKEVLNKMIEDKAVEILAKKKNLSVSRDEASQSVSRKLAEYNSETEVKNELDRLYGWTIADFEAKVVMPSLYQEKLEASIAEELQADSSVSKEKILSAQKSLRSGDSFSDVAKTYSDGEGVNNGGDMGWFASEDILVSLRPALLEQKIGVPGDVIESPLGFHIILVEEMKDEDGKKMYHLRQIFVRKTTFADFLSEKMQELSVRVLSPEYAWNKETARVEFQDQVMIDFEKKMHEDANGDATFFF